MNSQPNTEVEFTHEMGVELVDFIGGDMRLLDAARISTRYQTGDSGQLTPVEKQRDLELLEMLVRDRHHSPLEHSIFTFNVEVPVFVMRELMRHRIASYNEYSGRYSVMKPKFYLPNEERKLVQIGKPGDYMFEDGTLEQQAIVRTALKIEALKSWSHYQFMLDQGIAREVARMILPLSVYTKAYVTINARSLMNLLSLRIAHPNNTYPSFPLHEIEQMAKKMETIFKEKMPETHRVWNENGRIS